MSLQAMLEPERGVVAHSRRADQDRDLLEALRHRAPTAAERLVSTYGERAYRLAMRITGNGRDAEEVVQDALWAVVRKIDSFRGESAFGSWFYRIVANAAYQKLRTRPSRQREVSWDEVLPFFDEQGHHAVPMADWSPRVDDPGVQTELRVALTTAINDLPAAYRTVLVLRDVEGLSHAEIAALVGLSVPNVKTRVHRARLFLRKQLGEAMATLDSTTEALSIKLRRGTATTGDREGRASPRRAVPAGGLHRLHLDRDEPGRRSLLQPARGLSASR